jgi:hypothetical protein
VGNVYGIANPGFWPVYIQAGSDVACPAGAETTVMTSGPIIAPGPGDYFPLMWVKDVILLGATPPTALQVAYKIGAGADVDSDYVAPAQLVASATIVMYSCFYGDNSGTAWVGAGSTVNITVLSTGQPVTWKAAASNGRIVLFRGPDK